MQPYPAETVFYLILTVFLGLCLGSFATALSHRLPRGISILKKSRSACPACGRNLGIRDLVPVFSWLFLKGQCRSCQASIGWQYPLIELATLALCLAFYGAFGFSLTTLLLFLLAPVIVSMTVIDIRHKIIPDSLNAAMVAIGAAVLIFQAWLAGDVTAFIVDHGGDALGGLVLYGLGAAALRHACMVAMKREPLGLGDVKFFAVAGFWLGLDILTFSYFMFLAGVSGVFLALLWKKMTGEAEFPFGPALLFAFLCLLLRSGTPLIAI